MIIYMFKKGDWVECYDRYLGFILFPASIPNFYTVIIYDPKREYLNEKSIHLMDVSSPNLNPAHMSINNYTEDYIRIKESYYFHSYQSNILNN